MKPSLLEKILSVFLSIAIVITLIPGNFAIAADGLETVSDNEEIENAKSNVDAEAISMPGQEFTDVSDNGVAVFARAKEGIFPAGTRMVLRSLSKKKAIRIADKSVEDTVEDAIGVDISFIDENGNEIEPKEGQHVDVSLSLNKDLKGSSFKVIHQKDNGRTEIISSDANSAGANFATGSFSIYIIGGETAIATYNFYDTDNNKIISTQRVKNGDNLVKPKTPSKPEFKFTGWATAPDAQTPDFKGFGVQNNVAETTVSVYPVFKEIHYVFFMDSVGNDANPSRIIFTKEGIHGADLSVSDVVVPLDSTKKVISWHKDSSLSAESKVEKVTLDSENVTLYPNIKEGHYLTFDTGEGDSS